MDNLTHTLAGAALSRAGLDRATPLATATLVLAANAPDIDALAYAKGEYFALAFRRGVTHGVPAMVVLPFLVTGAILAWDHLVRRRSRRTPSPGTADGLRGTADGLRGTTAGPRGATTGSGGTTGGSPGATTGLPGATTGSPGATTGLPGATTGLPGATTGLPGATTGSPGRVPPDPAPARAGPVLALSAVGLLTHPVLDWMNTYGMRWWVPFDGSWTYGDALFIIDPWLWLLLASAAFLAGRRTPGRTPRRTVAWAILWAATSALVLLGPVPAAGKVVWAAGVFAVLAIRWRRPPADRARGRRTAAALTALAALYVAGMVLSDRTAAREVRAAAAAAGLGAEDVMVSPEVANPLAADVVVVTADGYVPGAWSWTRRPRVTLRPEALVPRLTTHRSADGAPIPRVLAAARAAPDARDWLVWSRYPYVRVVAQGGGWTVRFSDARYAGRGGAGGLGGVTVHVVPSDLER